MTPVFKITGNISVMPRPQGGGQLGPEIKRLREAGFDILVSLITPEEHKLLDLEREQEECRANNIEFVHFPIPDFNVPGDMNKMIALSGSLSERALAGNNVIIHCRGGIGRSSLMTAAILMQQGLSCSEAIELISEKRGCNVPETARQKSWLEKLHTTICAQKASLNR